MPVPTLPKPIGVSDNQLAMIMRACAPLEPVDRDPFLRALAAALCSEPQPLGDGQIFRAIKALQREHWRPPTIERSPLGPRHGTKSGQAPPIWAAK